MSSWPWPWLWRLLRRDIDPTWKPTGYRYTTERTYDYERAVRGARKAKRQTASGTKLPTAHHQDRRKAEVWSFPPKTGAR